jgi:3-oxoadipate enol-lactonase
VSARQIPSTQRRRAAGAEPASGWRMVDLPGRGTTYAFDRPHHSPTASTVVLLHGWTATGSLNWATTISGLADRCRVVALDHRGHGRGIRGDNEFTLEDCADDAVALLDVLGVRTAIVVGYSMGGPIAQLIWRRHRHRVSGMVLCATAADFTTTPDLQRVMGALEQLQHVTGVVPTWVRRRVARPFVTGLSGDLEMRRELLDAVGRHAEPTIREAGRAIGRFRSTDWIGEVDVPVVVIVTTRDLVVRPARQRQLARLIPGAEIITIDVGHLAAFSRPDVVADAVTAACADIEARSTPITRRRFTRWIRRLLQRRHLRRLIKASGESE